MAHHALEMYLSASEGAQAVTKRQAKERAEQRRMVAQSTLDAFLIRPSSGGPGPASTNPNPRASAANPARDGGCRGRGAPASARGQRADPNPDVNPRMRQPRRMLKQLYLSSPEAGTAVSEPSARGVNGSAGKLPARAPDLADRLSTPDLAASQPELQLQVELHARAGGLRPDPEPDPACAQRPRRRMRLQLPARSAAGAVDEGEAGQSDPKPSPACTWGPPRPDQPSLPARSARGGAEGGVLGRSEPEPEHIVNISPTPSPQLRKRQLCQPPGAAEEGVVGRSEPKPEPVVTVSPDPSPQRKRHLRQPPSCAWRDGDKDGQGDVNAEGFGRFRFTCRVEGGAAAAPSGQPGAKQARRAKRART